MGTYDITVEPTIIADLTGRLGTVAHTYAKLGRIVVTVYRDRAVVMQNGNQATAPDFADLPPGIRKSAETLRIADRMRQQP